MLMKQIITTEKQPKFYTAPFWRQAERSVLQTFEVFGKY